MSDFFRPIVDNCIKEGLSQNTTQETAKNLAQLAIYYAKPHAKRGFEHAKNFAGEKANSFAGDTAFDIIFRNALTIKNGYKFGARSALSFYHISNGGSPTYVPFLLNSASAGASLISLGCRGLGHVRQMPALTLLGDACSIAGDILDRINKGERHTRPTFMEIFL